MPYTGLVSLHPLLDHAGPIASSIRDCALLLSALGGYDVLYDARMSAETPLRSQTPAYHTRLNVALSNTSTSNPAKSLRVDILKVAVVISKTIFELFE